MPAKKKPAAKKAAKKKAPVKKTPAAKRPKTSDLDALQGTWHITSLELNGGPTPAVAFDGTVITVRGNKFASEGLGDPYTGILEIDQTKTPRAFDLVFDSGPQTGIRNLGIYELDGDDWRFCIDMGGVNRPKRFATRADSGVALETLRRGPAPRSSSKKATKLTAAKTAGPTATDEPSTGEPTEIEGEWMMLSAVFGGAPLADDMVKWCTRTTRGSVTKIVAGSQVMLDASFTLDQTRTPHQINYINRSGSKKGQPQAGIYEIADDALRICVAAPGDPRPSEFASSKGDGRSFTVWKRSTT